MTTPTKPLASLIDALGHRVTATRAPSGLLIILTLNPDSGLRDGHPALHRENARALRDALNDFIDNDPESRTS